MLVNILNEAMTGQDIPANSSESTAEWVADLNAGDTIDNQGYGASLTETLQDIARLQLPEDFLKTMCLLHFQI